ncbi:MAG: double-strand break repair protein AddB [Proteobacteria bacterium]|nr:double-strand break repair protein AddB [Pseudomonadota bacterium]
MSVLNPAPRIYTIAPELPFADALVDGLLHGGIIARSDADPLALSRVTILLPTRRACRALAEAFLRQSESGALLLPRIRPLGDLDEDESGAQGLAEGGDFPPALAPLRRQFVLAQLILARDSDGHIDQAVRLAQELGGFLDQAQSERLGVAGLNDLAPERHAAHWQKVLDFLKLLVVHWPKILAENDAVDIAARRNAVLDGLAAAWREKPPLEPVIAAGSTGSLPATADLMAVVARLPAGCLVLPGLDQQLDEDSWRALGPSHPQFGLKQLLARIGASRDDARPWPAPYTSAGSTSRAALIAQALHPAETVGAWRSMPLVDPDALENFTLCECATASAEAGVIALRLRASLMRKDATAALVTADRGLARRVATELKRWRIEIDDSAGAPLGKSAPGVFLRLAARLIAERAAPVAFLAALKHPLAAGGEAPEDFRRMLRAVERAVLRGARPETGLDGLRHALQAAGEEQEQAADWLGAIAAAALPFTQLMAERVALKQIVQAHVGFAEWLAASAAETAAERLWSGEAGEAAAAFMAELAESADHAPALNGWEYPALFDALLEGRVVRPRYGGHPRLFIWGPLEARLQRADVMILGGLNEGSWPPAPDADPWMSQAMRAEFGLPSHERRIGLSAHDFAQCCAAPEVMLTRARRVEGEPTVPSRWLSRLKAVLSPGRLDTFIKQESRIEQESHVWLRWQELLDEPDSPAQPGLPPAPRPPLVARPRRLSVTQIEIWLSDPYAIYARHILALRALDEIDADPSAADKGTIIHGILDRFIAEFPTGPTPVPSEALPRLLALGREEFARFSSVPGVMAFWWPRFERIAVWFVANEVARRHSAAPLASEVSGKLVLTGPEGDFTLTAKADRIDRLAAGGLTIIDYKTGNIPSEKQVAAGRRPQLSLEALIAEAGGFEGVARDAVAELAYWKLNGAEPAGEMLPLKKNDPAVLAAAAKAGLLALIAEFDNPNTPYHALPRPDAKPSWNDYAHLERVQEWSSGETEDEA